MGVIGIIGGTGLDDPAILSEARDEKPDTPYGKPSSPLKRGFIDGVETVILARHGREHTIPPSQVNYRANIIALREAGCSCILSTTAVGSLRDEIHPGDLVILDQFIDWTKQRKMTFYEAFEPHQAVHCALADPFDPYLREALIAECRALGFPFHDRGTVITIEGPRFSTRAESWLFRSWGADVINMSVATEAALANEAGIPYGAVAMSTDYDSWRTDEAPVNTEAVFRVFSANVHRVTRLLQGVIVRIGK
jgi:5'-methylthioadenosine phosphorylase